MEGVINEDERKQQHTLENDDELKKSSPLLFGMKKGEPFLSPKGYFDVFADELQKKMEAEELKEKAPVFSSLKKEEIFSAPVGYFESLPTEISKRKSEKKENWLEKAMASIFKPKFAFAITAVASVLVIVLVFWNPSDQNGDAVKTLADVPKEEIDHYVYQHYVENMSDDELAELIAYEENEISLTSDEEDEMEEFILDNVELHELVEEF